MRELSTEAINQPMGARWVGHQVIGAFFDAPDGENYYGVNMTTEIHGGSDEPKHYLSAAVRSERLVGSEGVALCLNDYGSGMARVGLNLSPADQPLADDSNFSIGWWSREMIARPTGEKFMEVTGFAVVPREQFAAAVALCIRGMLHPKFYEEVQKVAALNK